MNSKFIDKESLVIQFKPNSASEKITVNGKSANYIDAEVINYRQYPDLKGFQDAAFSGRHELDKVIISKIDLSGLEAEIQIPSRMKTRLLSYFKKSIGRQDKFDCHAFVSYLVDVRCVPEKPNFKWSKLAPKIGDVVCLHNDVFYTPNMMPNSIQHFAIYLGEDLFISKFGRTTASLDSPVLIMNSEGMHKIYETEIISVAKPKASCKKWDGTFKRKDES